MKQLPEVKKVEIVGEFLYEPLDLFKLSSLISNSELGNKDELLTALHWPSGLLKSEEPGDSDECRQRNWIRLVRKHLHGALLAGNEEKQQKFEYCVFSSGEKFYNLSGYSRAAQIITSKGYQPPRLLYFLAFALQIPKDLSHFNIAAPLNPDDKEHCLYPYFDAHSHRLKFDYDEGDSWMDGNLLYLSESLLFGVKPVP